MGLRLTLGENGACARFEGGVGIFKIISGPLSIRTSPVSDLRLRNSGNSTFGLAKSSLLCESASFQALCSLETVPGLPTCKNTNFTCILPAALSEPQVYTI